MALTSLLNVRDAADLLGVTDGRVRQLLRAGRLSGQKVTERAWLLDKRSVEKYRDSGRKAGRPSGK